MRPSNLAIRVLQDVRVGALQDARQTSAQTSGVFADLVAASAGFNANQLYPLVAEKLIENANRVRAASDTGDDGGRQLAFRFQDLCAGFATDHGMKVAHHRGIRMRPKHTAKEIVRGA